MASMQDDLSGANFGVSLVRPISRTPVQQANQHTINDDDPGETVFETIDNRKPNLTSRAQSASSVVTLPLPNEIEQHNDGGGVNLRPTRHRSRTPSPNSAGLTSSTPRRLSENGLRSSSNDGRDALDLPPETNNHHRSAPPTTSAQLPPLPKVTKPEEDDDNSEPPSFTYAKPKFAWDVFRRVAREHILDKGDKPKFSGFIQFCRLLIYIAIFFIVLISIVASRLSFLALAGAWKDYVGVESNITTKIINDLDIKEAYRSHSHFLVLATILFPTLLWLLFGLFRLAFSGKQKWPSIVTVLLLVFIECAHSVGVVIFINRVLPQVNLWKVTCLSMATSVIPSMCGMLFVGESAFTSCHLIRRMTRRIFNKLAYFGSISASLVAFIILTSMGEWKELSRWEVPTSLFLMSLIWTLNFTFSEQLTFFNIRLVSWPAFLGDLYRSKERMTVISCAVRLLATLIADGLFSNQAFWNLSIANPITAEVLSNWTSANLNMTSLDSTSNDTSLDMESALALAGNPQRLYVLTYFFVQIGSSLLGLFAGGLACKLMMQQLAFTLPILLATPLTVALMLLKCNASSSPAIASSPYISWLLKLLSFDDRGWFCMGFSGDHDSDPSGFRAWVYPTVLCCWFLGQTLASLHAWFPSSDRLAEMEKLFVLPGYSAPLLEQWLLFNRRLNDSLVLAASPNEAADRHAAARRRRHDTEAVDSSEPPVIPRIVACATMWHETREEMTQLLKSIFRMDKDHAERRRVLETLHVTRDPATLGAAAEILAEVNYYEFETHIIFDDAWATTPEGVVPNEFVKSLLDVLRDAGTAVYSRFFEMPDPTRIPTPYGGRLAWTLPGGTTLVVHMKDKNKIRHKKRWSQVMYMYYLLGYRLYCQDPFYRRKWGLGFGNANAGYSSGKSATVAGGGLRHRPRGGPLGGDDEDFAKIRLKLDKLDYPEVFRHVGEQTAQSAENTFLLTLDGDVDFRPSAVLLLIDLMKKSAKVGAACGRIHPTGGGPMVWYQRFEYAIAHWLQKAAEHVFGCVLCTPGCFSLFRGSALMDDNVMRAYATTSSEAAHYVQYDQGEDRWLCTLLLQQGYRAEYSAAADALTHAPETFNEFYQQRRRWGPSTLSNIIDLLSSWRQTVVMNDNISLPYICYQFVLLISTLLGPATIIMMIAGAYNAVFRVDLVQSYLLSLMPPIFFGAICLTTKSDIQLKTAAVLSAIYAVVMLVVVVGTIINGLQESLTSPNVIFVFSLFGIFISSGGFHPREFTDLTYGWLYVLCIPAGYLLLTIYSLCNMDNVSWGTRETFTVH